MRLSVRSIRGRMLLLSGVATLVVLVLAGLLIAILLGRVVTEGIDRRLDANIALLATSVGKNGQIDDTRLATVRGALDAGPGWRWQIAAPTRAAGSDDFPDLDLAPPNRGPGPGHRGIGPRPREGRGGDGLPVHARELTLETVAGRVVLRASAPRGVIERPIREAAIPLLVLLAILSAILAAASVLQIRYGLRPLRQLRDTIADIRSGRVQSVSEEQPEELRPLAEELNALTRDNRSALASARASAANLAHALKTPVATLALELGDDPDRSRQVARIEATIRHHLNRAREGLVDRRAATPLASAIEGLAAAISKLNAERAILFDVSVDPEIEAAVDGADFDEMAGNLIDNAARHARSCVSIRGVQVGAFVRITIRDDGPGLSAEEQVRARLPGVRLDESGEGSGFGLSIAQQLAALYGGSLDLSGSGGEGLTATIVLPAIQSTNRG